MFVIWGVRIFAPVSTLINNLIGKNIKFRALRIPAYLIVGVVTFLLTLIFLVRSPLTQTILARLATTYLSSQLNTEIYIERLEISGLRSIALTNLMVKDLNNDTLVFAGYLSASYAGPVPDIDIMKLGKLTLRDADVRIRKSEGDNVSNLQFLLDYFSGDETKTLVDTAGGADQDLLIRLGRISVVNSSFRFENPNRESTEVGVDFNNIGIRRLNLEAHDLKFEQDTFSVHVDRVSLHEKSGFQVDSLSCDFTLSPVLLRANNLLARTPLNQLDLDFSFHYGSMKDFQDFIDKVTIVTTIRPSLVNLSEVGYFAPVMFNMYNRLRLSASIRGTVSNFKARDLKVGIGRLTQFRGDVQMNGLPDIRETFSHLSISDFITTMEDVREFRLPTEEVYIDLPDVLQKFGLMRIKGKFTGFYNDFVSYGTFHTGIGDFETDLLLRVGNDNRIAYDGHLAANDFNAGRLFEMEEHIRRLDLRANIAGSGLQFDDMDVSMDGMIDSLEFFDNLYNEITISGSIANRKFSGELNVRDENVNLDFNGSLDYGSSIPAYNFTAAIRDAYLDRINLIERDSSSRLTTNLNINFMGDRIDNTQGIIIIDSTVFEELGKTYTMDGLTLSITRDSTSYVFLRLYSDLLDATMEGQYSLKMLPYSILDLFNNYMDTLVTDASLRDYRFLDQDFIFSVNLKETRALTELFVPHLEIPQRARFTGGYNERIGNLFVDGTCQEFTYGGVRFENWYADFYIQDSAIRFLTGAEKVFYSDTLKSDSLMVQIRARHDSVKYHVRWRDFGEVPFSAADLTGNFVLHSRDRYTFNFDRANFQFADTLWKVNPANSIVLDTGVITFNQMGLYSDLQQIAFHGVISPDPADTLLLEFREFDLSNFDPLLQAVNINMDGIMNGNIRMVDYYNSPSFLSGLHVDDFHFNQEKLGEVDLSSVWDPDLKAFDIQGSIIYTGNIGKDTTLFVAGRYYPERVRDNFDITVDLHKYKLPTLEPFIRSFSSDIQGMATGHLHLGGSTAKPEITGQVNVMRAAMLIDYLNVKYFFADRINFDRGRIYFENIVVNDSLNNQGVATGTIYHDHLTNFSIDLNITTDKLAAMNTTRSQNEAFYGQIFSSGNIHIHGPFSNLRMDIAARSEKGTNIKIPVSYGTEVGSSDYIVFVGAAEEKGTVSPAYDVDMRGLNLRLDLDVTNDADIQIFMPYNMGNMRGRGRGDILMNIDPAGNLEMEGDYVIDRGSFFFTLSNIINRSFDISRGSRVSWTGDPYNAQINLKAVYKVKTTLGEYGPPEDSATRVPVDCIIKLTNNLVNPEIKFTVEFPDLKDDIKQTIYSRLDTTDQAEMSRQMISLLVMNNFYQPSGFSGSVGFNTFDLVTNQLNNWLSSISKDVDIGVNYRPGDDLTSREVEVALSTQLFDERVLIDGNVGMRESTATTQNTNNIVGEVTVEVKITPDGRFRAKAFNRSNNNYLYRNFSPYTQGVGVFYTQEFNRVSEIFRGKKRKEAAGERDRAGDEASATEADGETVKK